RVGRVSAVVGERDTGQRPVVVGQLPDEGRLLVVPRGDPGLDQPTGRIDLDDPTGDGDVAHAHRLHLLGRVVDVLATGCEVVADRTAVAVPRRELRTGDGREDRVDRRLDVDAEDLHVGCRPLRRGASGFGAHGDSSRCRFSSVSAIVWCSVYL